MEETFFVSYEDAGSEEDAILALKLSVGDDVEIVQIETTDEGWEITYRRREDSGPGGGGGSGAPQSPVQDPGFW